MTGQQSQENENRLTFLSGHSEMAERIRRLDWSKTPLGSPENWPQALRSVVQIMLTSRYAMWMGWGPEVTFLYNDAYARMTLGAKHPWALGRPAKEVWAEIWPQIGPRIEHVLKTGDATWDEGLLLFLERSGYREETYHTFSYSPLDNDGVISGHLCVVTEETERIIGERRLAILKELATHLASIDTTAEISAALDKTLALDSRDLPFTLTYVFDDTGNTATLMASTGIPHDDGALGPVIVETEGTRWPLDRIREGANLIRIPLDERTWPAGPWHQAPQQAVILPIAHHGQSRPAGAFIAALNPYRAFDDAYASFLNLFVGQIAAGLANARAYEEARRRAEALAEIDRAKTVFFSNVSHEFRTPLTLLLGPLEEALSGTYGPLPNEHRTWVDLAHRNCLRLLKLVNTLLDFSRIEAGRQESVFEPTDVAALTADLASVFRSAVNRAGLRLEVDCRTLSREAYIDREMWEKVVLNLLSNALKFTFSGDIRVSLVDVGDAFELKVQDTGEGIPESELPRIFERFHRVQGTRSRTHEGTGIGLALVNELVKLHGGTIQVESHVGIGTAFVVRIPFGTAHLPADRIRAVKRISSTGLGAAPFVEEALRWLPAGNSGLEALPVWTPRDLDGNVQAEPDPATRSRILLADDNADMRDYVTRLLSPAYEVECVADGKAALEALRREPADLVLSDIMMPELDGFGLLTAIRADTRLQGVPVILLSARAGEESRVEGMSAGADDYLVKPFSARELIARVRAHLAMSRLRSQILSRLKESEQRLRIAVETAQLGSWELDLATGAVHASPELEVMYGVQNSEAFTAADWRSLIHPEDRDAVQAHRQRLLVSEDQSEIEFRILRSDGSVRWLTSRGFAVRDLNNQAVRAIGVVSDITNRKLAEQEREQLLASERYAREQAEAASRAKDEFLATVSHELRTPLNAMLGWARMLRSGKLSAHLVESALETIERNAVTQAQLIEDLLDVSRIVTGQLRLDVQPVDLVSIIQAATDSVRPAAEAKSIRLQMVLDPLAGPVAGDPIRMQQVVWNLLSNAIKFTPKDGHVQVRLERVNSHLEIVVSDNGQGIIPEFLPFVFDRFRQADSTITRRTGGMGLGLAIVRHIVELHGGSVEVHSGGPSQGATFTVQLPLMPVKETDIANSERKSRKHPAADSHQPFQCPEELVGLRVLLVDDEPDARELVSAVLAQCKVHVVAVESPEEARNMLRSYEPDVLICDIEMPDEDGFEFMSRVRETQVLPYRIPAAALTAHAAAADRMRALAAGFDIHLPKPIEPAELTAVVASLAKRSGRSRLGGHSSEK